MSRPVHFYLEGFSDTVADLGALKVRVLGLKTRYPDLVGKVCKVWIGAGVIGAATFRSEPSALIVVGAR